MSVIKCHILSLSVMEVESDDKNAILSKLVIIKFDPIAVIPQLTKYADTLSLTLEVVSLLYMFCHLVLLGA